MMSIEYDAFNFMNEFVFLEFIAERKIGIIVFTIRRILGIFVIFI